MAIDERYFYGAYGLDIEKARQAKTGWIPVSERLPEKNVEVLVTTEWDAITIGEMFSSNDWFIHEGTTNADIDEIKAWMPLPEPYVPDTNIGEMSENPIGSDDELYSDCIDAFKEYALGRK